MKSTVPSSRTNNLSPSSFCRHKREPFFMSARWRLSMKSLFASLRDFSSRLLKYPSMAALMAKSLALLFFSSVSLTADTASKLFPEVISSRMNLLSCELPTKDFLVTCSHLTSNLIFRKRDTTASSSILSVFLFILSVLAASEFLWPKVFTRSLLEGLVLPLMLSKSVGVIDPSLPDMDGVLFSSLGLAASLASRPLGSSKVTSARTLLFFLNSFRFIVTLKSTTNVLTSNRI
mmetsp:Transcript_7301/g.14741  ORF Transcript_7301/g.14741 Transcript_7301/m.14741 type:complete len:233 (-) Transcript_7301:257-955(-)